MARLNLHLFGPFQAGLDGAILDGFDSNKVRALLVYLAMERNRPHSREVLAGMLWPEQSQRSAMDNLRYALADLRRVLVEGGAGQHFLIVSRDRIQMDPSSDFWLDVGEFERLSSGWSGHASDLSGPAVQHFQEAVQLYRGSFLEGFTVNRSAPFEEWMLNQREQLQRLFVRNLSTIAAYFERLGEFQPALQAAWKQVDLEPWQEEAHQQLMRLLAFDGQRSMALAQYETCKDILASDLGVEPSVQTTRLFESIRDGTLYIPPHFRMPDLPEVETDLRPSLPTFYAREEELLLLDRSLRRTLTKEENQIVFVTGEAGSGKTSLVKEFIHQSLLGNPDLVAAYTNCNAFFGASDPYLPFIEMIEMLTGDLDQAWIIASKDRVAPVRLWSAAPEAVEALIESGPDLIGRLVSPGDLLARARALSHAPTSRLEGLIPQNANQLSQTQPRAGAARQAALFEQVLAVFKRIARQHSLILALDDLQWADADTLNLLFYLCRRLAGARIMVLGIYRQEEVLQAAGEKSVRFRSVLNELQTCAGSCLIDLARSDSRQFIQALIDSQPNRLGRDFRETLERVTGGIPLFAIELLRAMQSRGDLTRDLAGAWAESGHLNWEQLPPRVEAVIAEQVRRLPAEWQVILRTASIEGDDFTADVVARVLSLDPQDMVQQLSGEIAKRSRMVYATGFETLANGKVRLARYRFRHHLFQEYFYRQWDIVEQTHQHAAVGQALETLYGDQTDDIALFLARHFELAGMNQKAAVYLLQAGKKAVALFANERAINHFKKGLVLLDAAPETHERDLLELKLLAAQTSPLMATEGYISPNLELVFSRVQLLVKKGVDDIELFWVLIFLKSYYNLHGDPENSRKLAAQILKMARRSQNTSLLMVAHSRMVANCLYYAEWVPLQKHLKEMVRLYDLERHSEILYRVGSDSKTHNLGMAALGTWIMGYAGRAHSYCQTALELSQDLAHPMASWFANYYAAYLYGYTGETQEVKKCIDALLKICDEQDLTHYRDYARAWLGCLQASAGDENGLPLAERGISWMREIGDRMNLLMFLRLQAGAYLNLHQPSRALNVIDEALELAEKTQIIFEKPELLRLKGEILLAQSSNNSQKAEGYFIQAIEDAAAHQSKMWELRATANLTRLLVKTGRASKAQQRLWIIYSWFTEGLNTPELTAASALLEELAAFG